MKYYCIYCNSVFRPGIYYSLVQYFSINCYTKNTKPRLGKEYRYKKFLWSKSFLVATLSWQLIVD